MSYNELKKDFLSATEKLNDGKYLLLFVGIYENNERKAIETLIIHPTDIVRKRNYMEKSTNDNFEYSSSAKVVSYSICKFEDIQKHIFFTLQGLNNEYDE